MRIHSASVERPSRDQKDAHHGPDLLLIGPPVIAANSDASCHIDWRPLPCFSKFIVVPSLFKRTGWSRLPRAVGNGSRLPCFTVAPSPVDNRSFLYSRSCLPLLTVVPSSTNLTVPSHPEAPGHTFLDRWHRLRHDVGREGERLLGCPR